MPLVIEPVYFVGGTKLIWGQDDDWVGGGVRERWCGGGWVRGVLGGCFLFFFFSVAMVRFEWTR